MPVPIETVHPTSRGAAARVRSPTVRPAQTCAATMLVHHDSYQDLGDACVLSPKSSTMSTSKGQGRHTLTPSTPSVPSLGSLGGGSSSSSSSAAPGQPLQVGTPVLYFSRTTGVWVPAVVLGYNQGIGDSGGAGVWWSYKLDVHPQASPAQVMLQRQPTDAMSMRGSASSSQLSARTTASTRQPLAPWIAPAGGARAHGRSGQSSPVRPTLSRTPSAAGLGPLSPSGSTASGFFTLEGNSAGSPQHPQPPRGLLQRPVSQPVLPSAEASGVAVLTARPQRAGPPSAAASGRAQPLPFATKGSIGSPAAAAPGFLRSARAPSPQRLPSSSLAAAPSARAPSPQRRGIGGSSAAAAPIVATSARGARAHAQTLGMRPGTPASPPVPSLQSPPLAAATAPAGEGKYHFTAPAPRPRGQHALQRGCGPELWGITLAQLRELTSDSRHRDSMTTRDVVERIIKPDTAGTGAGYALLKNSEKPLRATVMVAHAWDSKFSDLVGALAASGDPGPFWVCATALYQPEDDSELTLERQLGPEAGGPLTTILAQVATLLCVLTSACNIYARLWCVFEIFTAVQLGVEVRVTSRQSGRYGLGALEDVLLKLCDDPIDSCDALCGADKCSGTVDRAAIRSAIQASPGGHRAVDIIVEESRLDALIRGRDRLKGGGWKDTNIARQYQDAINTLSFRLGKFAAPAPSTDAAATTTPGTKPRRLNKAAAPPPSASKLSPAPFSTSSSAGGGGGGGCRGGAPSPENRHLREYELQKEQARQHTPRTNTRNHWAPTISM